ncbi:MULTISPECIES: hypothetical protein [Chromobacterium]|nr:MULTISPECIES: hypothetical protein [Chromobacterium]
MRAAKAGAENQTGRRYGADETECARLSPPFRKRGGAVKDG